MTCEQCKYHDYIPVIDTHFCESSNHKHRTVRISREDAVKDINCRWTDKKRQIRKVRIRNGKRRRANILML